MISLNDMIWPTGDTQPENNTTAPPGDASPQGMTVNCLAMCCAMGNPCSPNDHPGGLCWIGRTGCR